MSDDLEIEKDDVETDLDGDVGYSASEPAAEVFDDGSAYAREQLRKQLQSDVEAFLAAGGRINEVPPNVVGDPPRKPQNNYGGQPI